MSRYNLLFFRFPQTIIDNKNLYMKCFLSMYENLDRRPVEFEKLKRDILSPLLAIKKRFPDLENEGTVDDFKKLIYDNFSFYSTLFRGEEKVLKELKEKYTLYLYVKKEDADLLGLNYKGEIREYLKRFSIDYLFENIVFFDNDEDIDPVLKRFIDNEGYFYKDALLISNQDELKTEIDSLGSDFTSESKIYSYQKLKETIYGK